MIYIHVYDMLVISLFLFHTFCMHLHIYIYVYLFIYIYVCNFKAFMCVFVCEGVRGVCARMFVCAVDIDNKGSSINPYTYIGLL